MVTNAPRDNAVAMLAAAALAHRLPTVVIGDECARPKPDPAPYRAGMAALGATPSRAVAFEDSRSGLRAARAAGAHCFGLTTGLAAAELLNAGAHATIADFTDPALWAHLETLEGERRMTRTVVESKSRTVVIGFDQPFCVIGERINPTGPQEARRRARGRRLLDRRVRRAGAGRLRRDGARRQLRRGLHQQDGRGPALRRQRLRRADADAAARRPIQALVDVPLCIDSSVPGALQAGLETCEGRPLLNSVTGEEERLELVLPLVKKYNVPVVAISNDDTGISEDPDVRFEVARKIVHRAADFGIPAHDIVVDPLVMPVGAMATAGLQVFALVRRLREELGVNTTCGASNISFGLPNRHGINAAFLPMAIASGMTSAIMNPVRPQEMEAIRAANLLMNADPWGAAWIAANKAPLAEGEVEAGARGRREGRRRRA